MLILLHKPSRFLTVVWGSSASCFFYLAWYFAWVKASAHDDPILSRSSTMVFFHVFLGLPFFSSSLWYPDHNLGRLRNSSLWSVRIDDQTIAAISSVLRRQVSFCCLVQLQILRLKILSVWYYFLLVFQHNIVLNFGTVELLILGYLKSTCMKVCFMCKSPIFISSVMIWFSIGFLGLSMENGNSKGRLVFMQHIHTDFFIITLLHRKGPHLVTLCCSSYSF